MYVMLHSNKTLLQKILQYVLKRLTLHIMNALNRLMAQYTSYQNISVHSLQM